ncbi:MBL fold metallo-hydrolase [Mucilaginibacter sp. Bleaf8]|uniref:MBL fold metallo-hydrolase n=1 Tax=Mucilaginibacter sp. Bleaf8 TaxID=2834430 RepID=UPI001BCAC05E|nr:MBL fold metallo-hydrolase [Mucilaginibacter sp. Bleaf8]MBS7564274.1 MBL fold metallo-hydrolase [Mucilaginibacter sp. Bleaf8]
MSLKGAVKHGKKFQNLIHTDPGGLNIMLPILREYLTNKAENTPKNPIGPFTTDAAVYQTPPASGLRVTWMGHSSLLIEIDGKRLLTDPVWSSRASFTQLAGPKRFYPAPLALADLPPLDGILISHDHYDHFDENTIRALAPENIPFYCSLGVGQYLEAWGVAKHLIHEMDWGDVDQLGTDFTITTAPARHFAGRSLGNRNETLWSSFVLKGPKHNVYFGADSGWFDTFYEIGEAYGPFDLTILEIGAYGKYWPDIHMGPANATQAHLALNGKQMMPIHWATFNLAPHAWYEPIEKLLPLADEKQITLFVPEPGLPTEVTGEQLNSGWWKKYR